VPILTRKTMVYAETESTYGTAATMADATSPMLVEDASFMLDINKIERNPYRSDLGNLASIVGRKVGKMKFSHELRNNGVAATECRIMRLMRGCTLVATNKVAGWVGAFISANSAPTTPVVTWTNGGSITITEPKTALINVTTGGATTVARFSVTWDDGTATQTGLGASGTGVSLGPLTPTGLTACTFIPTWSGALLVTQAWVVTVWPIGIQYLPSSIATNYASLTINMYKDGLLHQLTGAYGTFKINAQAGQRAMVEFEFTGFYTTPTDVAFPASPIFESTLPVQVELGRLHMDNFGVMTPVANTCAVDAFSFDIGNKIEPRSSINAANGWTGLVVSDRNASGGIDPEATLVATQDFWTKLSAANQMHFGMKVGVTTGNILAFHAPAAQYTGLTYKDRTGIVALDAAIQFNRVSGDDEFFIYSC